MVQVQKPWWFHAPFCEWSLHVCVTSSVGQGHRVCVCVCVCVGQGGQWDCFNHWVCCLRAVGWKELTGSALWGEALLGELRAQLLAVWRATQPFALPFNVPPLERATGLVPEAFVCVCVCPCCLRVWKDRRWASTSATRLYVCVFVCECVITGFGLGVDTLVTVINGFWAVRKPGLQWLCLIFTLFLHIAASDVLAAAPEDFWAPRHREIEWEIILWDIWNRLTGSTEKSHI